MGAAEKALHRFEHGHSCAQAVFSALAEGLGMDYSMAVKVSCGFGGGMGRMAGTCGAVTGGMMAMGLRYGGVDAGPKEKTYELVREFANRFKARHGSLECKALLDCDISTPDGLEYSRKQDLHSKVCTNLVRDAADIAEELCAPPKE